MVPRRYLETPKRALCFNICGARRSRRCRSTANILKTEQLALIGKWIDQLPQEEPEAALRKAEAGLLVAEKELAWARAALPALEARITADKAKFQPSPGVNAEALAETARKAERQAHLLKAESELFQAQRKLSEALSGPVPADEKADKDREKKISAARQGG